MTSPASCTRNLLPTILKGNQIQLQTQEIRKRFPCVLSNFNNLKAQLGNY